MASLKLINLHINKTLSLSVRRSWDPFYKKGKNWNMIMVEVLLWAARASFAKSIIVWNNCALSGSSFDFRKVSLEQKNIFFPSLYFSGLQHKGHRLPFPTPWEANITFFRAGLLSSRTWPHIIWVWLGHCYRNLNSPWGFTVVTKKWLFVQKALWSLEYCRLSSNSVHVCIKPQLSWVSKI